MHAWQVDETRVHRGAHEVVQRGLQGGEGRDRSGQRLGAGTGTAIAEDLVGTRGPGGGR